ncbi:deoxyribose-phosphate aldolase [Rhizobiaceae bacterium BDR2-2]|uniref:Deoxyribose-phosphate aldolase n=1 Tax=Ectorhizobium quercum TaxID=2965071 RepID=A0AAE3MVJ9_9HYPH|nr:deoxyribose-phosphate aldolase [Ectorhizobium quercum]MCX8995674.1 deoxyribose-phosphate aldolase [Ectorhizobium quercum]
MSELNLREAAAVALTLLDLTNLRDDCTEADVVALAKRAHTPFGDVAAICIWPRFVAAARRELGADSPIRIATVVNFPSGDEPVADVVAETRRAIADGADEIDLVLPYRALMAGDAAAGEVMVKAVREACPAPVKLKVIIESGELKEKALIRQACDIAIAGGADFVKTSTGKVAVNATLEAADTMLLAIRDSGRNVGFKAAGGIATVNDAVFYLDLADTIRGPDWAIPSTFRFGASGLLDNVLAVLAGSHQPAARGY